MIGKLGASVGLVLALFVSGCGSSASLGRGPMPVLPETPDPELSPEEIKLLLELRQTEPELVHKLQSTTNAREAVIQKYNQRARKHNEKLLEHFGLKDHTITRKGDQ